MAYKPDKHGRDHCPGGEDPIPCFSPSWVAANGLVYSSGDTEVAFDELWTGVWLDQNPSLLDGFGNAYFEIVQNPGGSIDGSSSDAFGIRLRQNGLYTFNLKIETSDLSAGDDHEIFVSMRLGETSTALMPNYSDLAAANNTLLLDLQETVEAGNDGQWIGQSSLTTPIYGIAAGSVVKTGKIEFSYSNPGVDNAWNFYLWIARFGPVDYGAADDMADPTYGLESPIG